MERETETKGASKYQAGHRKRMKDRFLSQDKHADSELLEIILYLHYPRIDVKPIVKDILKEHKTLRGFILFAESKDAFTQKYSESLFFVVKLIKEITLRTLISEVEDSTMLSSWSAMVKYLQLRFGSLTKECFSVIYLNTHYKVIDVVEFGSGTIDESVIYAREIVKTGLQKGASSIVLCHNHPSDDTTPSSADINITQSITQACKAVDINVIDHVIISKNNHFSFKKNGMID